ncbi:MAG: hypothetical protein FJX44_07570 [Alphaproteobacteria bacterium]|nr:hypothetical protein [Alphaproteobacteria bacterium]
MKFALIISMALIGGLLWSLPSALAAPREVEDYCFDQASKRSFNGRGEREAFIANCIADLTPTPRWLKRRASKKYNY